MRFFLASTHIKCARRGHNMFDYLVLGSIRLDCRLIGKEEKRKKSGHSRCECKSKGKEKKTYNRCRMSRHS